MPSKCLVEKDVEDHVDGRVDDEQDVTHAGHQEGPNLRRGDLRVTIADKMT